MRIAVLALLVSGCGLPLSGLGVQDDDGGPGGMDAGAPFDAGDGGAPPPDAGPGMDGGAPTDGGPVDAGEEPTDGGVPTDDAGPGESDAGRPDAGPPPFSLGDLSTSLPCGTVVHGGGRGCDMPTQDVDVATLSGPAGAMTTLTFTVRGVVELNTFTGTSWQMGNLTLGGSAARPGWSDFVLEIASPAATYHLNADTGSSMSYCLPLDYTFTAQVAVGSQVRLRALSGDDIGWKNLDSGGTPISIGPPLPSGISEPYDGQFVYVTAR